MFEFMTETISSLHWPNITLTDGLIYTIAGLITLICILLLIFSRYKVFKMMKESHLSIMSLHPYLGIKHRENAVSDIVELAQKGKNYKKDEIKLGVGFHDFIEDLPVYCITDTIFSSFVRKMLSSGGARFQQVILHDSSCVDDVYVYIQRKGNYFIHDKGLYAWPFKNSKRIQHWDINDLRPLEDKTDETDWKNPLMNARIVAGMVNSNAMKPKENGGKTSTILIVGVVILIIAVGYIAYVQYQNQKVTAENTKIIFDMLNNISSASQTVTLHPSENITIRGYYGQ